MAAPTNSGESDMATEDFCLNLSPLPSPRWSVLSSVAATGFSTPQAFLPSSNSTVMQYQGSNQSTYNPKRLDDIVDLAPYLAGDSALLPQQQPRQNWSEASDWRPRGEGIMRMNNQGFEESNMGFEEESEEEMMTCFYFPQPSPTYFPLYRPMPTVFFVSTSNIQDISLALSYQHILEDKSGALHVLNWEEGKNIFDLLFDDFASYMLNKFGDWDQMARALGMVPKGMESLADNILEHEDYDEREATLRRINWLEQPDKDIVDQLVFEVAGVVQQLIQNRSGELDVIFGGGVFMLNGLECRVGTQGLPTAPETLLICQAKHSFRVWLGHGGQWAAEARYRCSCLNIGSFTTVEDAISAYEVVRRWGGQNLTSLAGLFENENRSKLPLQLSPPTQELNPVEDLDWCAETGSERTGERVIADQARLSSGCLGKRKAKEKKLEGKRRNKKTNGVRIAIPLEDISQTKRMRLKDAANHLGVSRSTLKRACREYGIKRWPPRKEHELINETRPNKSIAVVDQEQIPQLNSDTVLPSNQPRKEHELISQTRPNESPMVVDQEQTPQLNSNKVLLPSNQVSATIDTKSVKLKARYEEVTIAFRLSWPFRKVELELEVKKRLPLEAGTYNINYKDEDDDLILISCDEDLEECISSSSRLGTYSIELFLIPK